MTKICTSLYQSKKLVKLGIDVNTSDMRYQHIGYSITDGKEKPTYFLIVIRDNISDDDIPAWSLAALLKMLPLPTLEETMITTTETKWKCTVYCKSYDKYWSELYDDAIDAVFELVVWLKENGKI